MKSVPSDNILQLRVLTDKICSQNTDNSYKEVVKELKQIVEIGKEEIDEAKSTKTKIKCYESMCIAVTNILNKINIK
jgi:hypothetical protein